MLLNPTFSSASNVEASHWRCSWFYSRVRPFKCYKKCMYVCMHVFSRPALKKNAIHREMKQMCISSPLFLFVSVLSRKKYPLITSPQRSKYKSNEYILFSIFGLECLLALLLLSRIRTDPYHRLPGFSLSPPQTHKDAQQTQNQDRL